MLNSVGSNVLNNVVNGTSSATVGPNVVGNTQNSYTTVQVIVVIGAAILLLLVLCCIGYISRYREHRVRRLRHMNYLREHGPGPDVPNVVMELDVVHNAQSRENQSQCVESRPFICNHGGQENGDNDINSQVSSVFRLQGIFPR
ncbi:hypothetical protein [Ehrlichia muris]|uniref:hypothetical protein n=1 Tax=Ehrlichia muris TaxID=35795 RepID=UPI0037BE9394